MRMSSQVGRDDRQLDILGRTGNQSGTRRAPPTGAKGFGYIV
jgi:hypothetical protein